MGVIQQSVNQAFSIAGLANQLNPSFQNIKEAIKTKHFAKNMQKVIDDPAEDPETKEAATKMFHGLRQRQANYAYEHGYSAQDARLAARMQGKVDKYYDEQRAQEANQRAEDTARQVSEQSQRNRDILNQLRGLLPMSQDVLAKRNARIAKEGNK